MSSALSSSRRHAFALSLLVAFVALPASAQRRPKPPAAPPASPPAPSPSAAPSAASPADPTLKKKEEAKERFERAMTLFDKKAWDAALAEFLESRAAYATRSNTQNAGICLRNLNRFDEALDMFEALLKEFPNLSLADRQAVEKEISELEQLVGTIEIRASENGAQVAVDGRDRGQTPTPPVRVSAGSHVVRVYKEGLQPFEKRVEVAGRQALVVEPKLDTLAQSGRLSVSEDSGKAADVVIDNVVVGKTPWQGLVGVGDHVVFLRGEGSMGTQPASAAVRINQVTPIVLALEALECPLKVVSTPSGATVAIDGVVVGAGVWDGRLRKGRHKVEVAQNGFVPVERIVELAPTRSERVAVALERDPNSPLWRIEKPPRIFAELSPSFPIALVFGGDVSGGGSASFPLGAAGRVHVGYELSSGIGFGLDAGYMYITRTVDGRDTVLRPVGKPDAPGTANDELSLRGVLVGAAAHLHRGDRLPLLFRLGLGAFFGSANDRRGGDFTAGTTNIAVDTTRTASDVSYLFVAPEVRVGYKIVDRVEVSVGTDVMLMVALKQARWDPANGVVLGSQGLASYGNESLVGGALLVVSPGIAARFDF